MAPHHRRSIRLKGYDYASEGAYFVTLNTQDRRPHFGRVADAEMVPSMIGDIVQRCWEAIPEHFPNVLCDAFQLMPDHVHGILVITERAALPGPVGADDHRPRQEPDPPPGRTMPIVPHGSLGRIIRAFKGAVAREAYKEGLILMDVRLWQRNYYEHIIRNAASHARIARYIANNPANWKEDGVDDPWPFLGDPADRRDHPL